MNKSDFYIFDRDTLLHLRLPFSFFLFPVYLFALSQTADINIFNAIVVFISLHFFIYPGSNIYNSYMDNDKGSIGMLKNPPPVTKKLYIASILFDSAGLLLCLLISLKMALLMILYIAVSKAYSWKGIRLKRLPFTGWLVVMLFQGGFTYLLVNMPSANNFSLTWFNLQNCLAMLLASLLIGGYYPLTQIYQHEEDTERGDKTISSVLGVKGTFIFTIILFAAACSLGAYYFSAFYNVTQFYLFLVFLLPVISYFLFWMIISFKNIKNADYEHAMRMTMISSCCLLMFYGILFFLNH